MFKTIGRWFGTVLGKVVALFLAVCLGLLIVKWQSIYDGARARWWANSTAAVATHTAAADSAIKLARGDSAQGSAAMHTLDVILQAPEIRRNEGAQRVGHAARVVINARDSEIVHLKTAVKEEKLATEKAVEAGEKPVPRIQPYADIGYARTLSKAYGGVPVVRVGATYRVVGWLNVKGELSYEPPPSISQQRISALDAINERDYARPEVRATVMAHISFR